MASRARTQRTIPGEYAPRLPVDCLVRKPAIVHLLLYPCHFPVAALFHAPSLQHTIRADISERRSRAQQVTKYATTPCDRTSCQRHTEAKSEQAARRTLGPSSGDRRATMPQFRRSMDLCRRHHAVRCQMQKARRCRALRSKRRPLVGVWGSARSSAAAVERVAAAPAARASTAVARVISSGEGRIPRQPSLTPHTPASNRPTPALSQGRSSVLRAAL